MLSYAACKSFVILCTPTHAMAMYSCIYTFSSAAKTTHSEPTGGYLTITTSTASAVVQPSLDSRAQPVATGYVVPLTSTQFNSPLVAGMQTHRLQVIHLKRYSRVCWFQTSDYILPPFYTY